jgi:hypothetical protein
MTTNKTANTETNPTNQQTRNDVGLDLSINPSTVFSAFGLDHRASTDPNGTIWIRPSNSSEYIDQMTWHSGCRKAIQVE